MRKQLLFLLLINSFLVLNAQNEADFLINQTFSSRIASVCEETPDGYDCSGFEVYLTFKFTKESVSVLEKEVPTCGEVDVISNKDYKWELTQDSILKIQPKPKVLIYPFFDDLVLKIENQKVLGYKKKRQNEVEIFEFVNDTIK